MEKTNGPIAYQLLGRVDGKNKALHFSLTRLGTGTVAMNRYEQIIISYYRNRSQFH